jgi:hypothetical protein
MRPHPELSESRPEQGLPLHVVQPDDERVAAPDNTKAREGKDG